MNILKKAYHLGQLHACQKLGAMVTPLPYAARTHEGSATSPSLDKTDEMWRSFDRENQLNELSKVGNLNTTFGVGAALKTSTPGAAPKLMPSVPKVPKPQGIPGAPAPMASPMQKLTGSSNTLNMANSMQSTQKRLMGNAV